MNRWLHMSIERPDHGLRDLLGIRRAQPAKGNLGQLYIGPDFFDTLFKLRKVPCLRKDRVSPQVPTFTFPSFAFSFPISASAGREYCHTPPQQSPPYCVPLLLLPLLKHLTSQPPQRCVHSCLFHKSHAHLTHRSSRSRPRGVQSYFRSLAREVQCGGD